MNAGNSLPDKKVCSNNNIPMHPYPHRGNNRDLDAVAYLIFQIHLAENSLDFRIWEIQSQQNEIL